MKIKQKLLLVALAPLVVAGGIIVSIIVQMNQIQSNSSSIVKVLTNVEKLNGSMLSIESSLANFSFSTSDSNAEVVSANIKQAEEVLHSLEKVNNKNQKNQVTKIKLKFQALKAKAEKAVTSKDQAEAKRESIRSRGITNDIYLLNKQANEQYAQSEVELKDKITFTKWFALIAVSILLIIAGILVYLQTSAIANAVRRIAKDAQTVANGDLTIKTVDVKSKDEIHMLSTAFSQMVGNLKELLQTVGKNSEQVAASAEELSASADEASKGTEVIASSIQQVSSGADHQSKMVQESARAIEETTIGISRIAEAAGHVTEITQNTQTHALEGQRYVAETVEQMDSIRVSVDSTDKSITELNLKSKQITDIVKMITEIADQTNLLALNAAIEAARAGESGKGFAVVADEVRKLAEQTSKSASQINIIIKEVQDETIISVQSMDKVKNKVVEGINITNETARKFEQIVSGMMEVVNEVTEISATSQQISAGSQQVAASVNEMANVASQTSNSAGEVASASEEQLASMEEINASAHSLTNIAEELHEQIRKFKTS
ncbi:methyl-accepting chemotaxis protein [Ferdinandcohnia quinoae]|uniref:Methyl-accepting chemotaxis protein n=1 Tax=Fredinandcohnia quinoae TaxID=2918902 RepID=A0AAW5E487_9BACI|nr:HAMP domain-containing methyl-accepting chemotaxis protein [Fredinandcohnia sp. SECRCQ15]MCH1624385.1 methyl-accepting chemotaxis protein [Fredinandcohnia sp. SECRCQ15]